ncbi:LacI family DNA-binding transcriptional regulator [Actinomyces ruminicola]|uniref:LacI family DNA-binding transcriptional regulator n=1 Tax=Actinomyces ruminicola TaxID=332524 RepID=UPI00164FBEDF|nr:LacI family DNA-binding transcriptional regulator [Actinomyces ruminicola]
MTTVPNSRHHAPTQGDVARLAGVSAAVVSYVVNDGPRPVSPEARKRVLAAIDSLGYQPNASARALRSGTSRLIGVAAPEMSNPYQAELVEAITVHARAAGFGTLLVSSGNSPEDERLALSSFLSRGIDGLITSSLVDATLYSEFARRVPTTVLNAETTVPGCQGIGPEGLASTRLATRHLIEHGHTRIALIIGPLTQWPVNARQEGWSRELQAAGLAPAPCIVRPWTREGGYDASLELLDLPEPPTAIVAASDLLAIGALRACHERGILVPEDLAIISFDGSPESFYANPQLTTLVQPIDAMAARAVETITDPPPEPRLELFPLPLRIGASCGCPNP